MNTRKTNLLASSVFGGVALAGLLATQAFAQATAPPEAGAGVQVQELVVTGSRIPQPNLTSVSPVQVVNAQEITIQGRTATIDILNQLPQIALNATNDFGPTSNALANPGGVATVDLRGLGPQRTLVLVNGRRLGIGDPNTGNTFTAPDINQIPSQLIDRIEVLTGGASAVYGSDAVAGVVNFIMKKNFEGVQLDAQWGVNQHSQRNDFMQGLLRESEPPVPIPDSAWDGRSADYSLIFGANVPDGKGNITAYVTYHDQDPIFQNARDFSACQLDGPPPICFGSSNSNIFYTSDNAFGPFAVVGNQFLPWPAPGQNPPAIFNSNPYISLLQQDTRYTGGFFANYKINTNFDIYTEFAFMHDQTNTQVAPTALFQGDGVTASGGFLVNCNNPLMSAQQAGAIGCSAADIASGATRDMFIGRRNLEGGPRQFEYDHDNYRIVLGSRGKFWGPFDYDLYGSYYSTSVYIANRGFFSKARAQNALLVGGTAANPVCLSGAAGCVPYNIFSDNGVTTDQLAYLNEIGTSHGSTTERIIEATITGSLGEWGIKSPWANDALSIALGFQSRRDSLIYTPDEAETSNDLTGFGGAATAIDKSLGVREGYGELRAPILQDKPFAQDLSLNMGYRYSDYNVGFTADTYKIGAEWSPTRDIRVRGGFNRAVRAPSIIELFSSTTVTNTSVVSEDPCAAGAAAPATLEQCLRTGINPAQYLTIPQCPANQCATLQGGSPDLQPERANTYTVGFVLTPRAIPGLYASIDWFHVNLKGIISTIPQGVTLNECLASGDPAFCSNVIRNPVNGILFGTTVGAGGYIVATNVNVAAQEVSGLDVQGSYRLDLATFGHEDWGSITFAFTGSFLAKQLNTPLAESESYDCAGLFGSQCNGMFPKWRNVLRVTWNAPRDVQLTMAWRRIGSVTLETDSDQPIIGGSTEPDPISHQLPAVNYLDLAANWNVNEKLALRGGVNNVFDKDPPLIQNAIVGGAFPNTYNTYDLVGRHLFIALTARF